jgi:hypothetical protein
MTELAKGQTELSIKGDVVQIAIRCKSHYEALLLYDRMIAESERGGVMLTMSTRPKPTMEKV